MSAQLPALFTAWDPLFEKLGWVLLHSIWQFSVIVVLAATVRRLMQGRGAAARYGMLICAFTTLLVAPVVTWFSIQIESTNLVPREVGEVTPDVDRPVRIHVEPIAAPSATERVEPSASVLSTAAELAAAAQTRTRHQDESLGPTVDPVEPRVGEQILAPRLKELAHPWLPTLVFGWCLGVIVFSLRPLFGWYTVGRLRSKGLTPVPERVQRLFESTTARLSIRVPVQLLQSTLVAVPVVIGFLKPIVLLPASVVMGLPKAQLEAILAHELAHVRRYDYLVNVLQSLIETVFFYHPGVWWLSNKVRLEREYCCDDIAVALLDDRRAYGHALLAVAELSGSTPVMALGMSTSLQARVRRLCGIEPAQGAWTSVVVCLLLLAMTVSATAWAWQPPRPDSPRRETGQTSTNPGLVNSASENPPPLDSPATAPGKDVTLQLLESDGRPVRRAIVVAEASFGYPSEKTRLTSWTTDDTGSVTLPIFPSEQRRLVIANPNGLNPTPLDLTHGKDRRQVHRLAPVYRWQRRADSPALQVQLLAIPFGRQQFLEIRLLNGSDQSIELPSLALLTEGWRIWIPRELQEDVFEIKPGSSQLIRLDWDRLIKQGLWEPRNSRARDAARPTSNDPVSVQLQLGKFLTNSVSMRNPGIELAPADQAETFGPFAIPPFSRETLDFDAPVPAELFYNRVPSRYSLETELAPSQTAIPVKNQLAQFALKAGFSDAAIVRHFEEFRKVLARIGQHGGEDIATVLDQVIADSEKLPAFFHVAAMSMLLRRSHDYGDSLSASTRNQVIWRTGVSALRHADKIPAGVKFSLLWSATYASLQIPSDQPGWGDSRRELTRLWLASLQQLTNVQDPTWDPDPDKAPAIDADTADRQQYSVQLRTRRVLERALPDAEELICQLYIRAPAANNELKKTLREFPLDNPPFEQDLAKRLVWTTDQMGRLFPGGYVPDTKLGLLQSSFALLGDRQLPVLHELVTDPRTVYGIRTEAVYGIGMKGHPSSLPALREFVKRDDIKGHPLEYALAHIAALMAKQRANDDPAAPDTVPVPPTTRATNVDQLPEWLRPFHGNGLLASLDDDGQVVEITAGSSINNALIARMMTLPRLRKLYLESSDQVTGDCLLHVGAMPALESLELGSIRVADKHLAHLNASKTLTELSLREAHIGDAGVSHLKGMQQLRVLRLGGNRLTDTGVADLRQLTNLEVLDISHSNWVNSAMKISDTGLEHVAELTKLAELNIRGLGVTDSGFAHLATLRNLRVLNVGGTQITGEGLGPIVNFGNLESLTLGGTWIRDAAMKYVGECKQLKSLTISYTRIGDEGFRHLKKLNRLEQLSIDSRFMTDAGLEHLVPLEHLLHLELRASQIGDAGLRSVGQLASLKYLSLSGSGEPGVKIGRNFTENGYAHLAALSNLEQFHLNNADVKWSELKMLKQLKALHMLMPTMSADDVRQLQRALPNTRVSATWGGGSVTPLQVFPQPLGTPPEPSVQAPPRRDVQSVQAPPRRDAPPVEARPRQPTRRAGPDWISAEGGIEYRVRQKKSVWRVNEIPLLMLDLRNRGSRRDLHVDLHQTQQAIDVHDQTYRKNRPWGGAERLTVDGDPVTIPFTLCDWTAQKPPHQPLELGLGKHAIQFRIQVASFPPQDALEPRGRPFEFVTDAFEVDVVRASESDNAAQTALENIHNELVAFPRFHAPFISPTLKRLMQSQQPQSSELLVSLLESEDETLHWPAAVTLAKFWDSIPDPYIQRYLQSAISHTALLRPEYPQGVNAAIGLGFTFRASYHGMPADKKYLLETTTTHLLNGQVHENAASRTSRRHGLGSRTGRVYTQGLPLGPHQIQLVTDYTFTRGEFTCQGQVKSASFEFKVVAADTPDHLQAPPDPAVAERIAEALLFAETEDELRPVDQPFHAGAGPDSPAADRWQPQMSTTFKNGTSISLHMPHWKLAKPLPLDLCFHVEIHLLDGTILDGGELVVLKGKISESYFSSLASGAFETIAERRDENGQVSARFVLKPSRAFALSNPAVTQYFNEEVTTRPLRIFVNGAKPIPANPAGRPGGRNDVAWGRAVSGVAIGAISTRTKPQGNTVPQVLAFFRNDEEEDQLVVRSAGFFLLELNGQFFGPFDLNGKSSPLTPGERLGPVTIEPATLRNLDKPAPGERPGKAAVRPRLRPGPNRLRLIYWHHDKPVYSGTITLTAGP